MFEAGYIKHILHFNRPGTTSRGVLTEKTTYLLHIKKKDSDKTGWGECSTLPGLSIDHVKNYEEQLRTICATINAITEQIELNALFKELIRWPSIQFGLETALKDLEGALPFVLFPSPFTRSSSAIPINGLIWMAAAAEMRHEIQRKLNAGFSCIKIKIGALDFEQEFKLLKELRQSDENLEIRVDANGAFHPGEALRKLERLASLGLHSIEQPIRAGQLNEMAKLCRQSPLPIALDEELIGVLHKEEKEELMDVIRPQYLILKPSLIGGFVGSSEWIALAEKRNIGWWVTSALESNIGLNAISQWTYTLNNPLPQGLGTGKLFSNNIPSPLWIKGNQLWYAESKKWDLSVLNKQ